MFKFRENTKGLIIISTILMVMLGLLFRESFSGLLLQGVDDNISMRSMLVRSLSSGQGYHFFPNYWVGYIFNVSNPDLYNTILALTGSVRVVLVYIIALMLSGIITYQFMRRLEISVSGTIFGSLSYTFLPHVLSLVYSGHALALEAIPMTPAFLLCLSVILDGKTEKISYKILGGIWGGIFWAWMMIGEPQRGTYGTVLAMAWTLYLLTSTQSIFWKKLFSRPTQFISLDTLKQKISYLFLIVLIGLGIFSSTIKFWTNSEFLANQGSWEFATSWSFPPQELIDSFAFGYHGLSSSEADFPYYGDKPMSGNTDSLGFFLMFFTICALPLLWKAKKKYFFFFTFAGLLALLLSFGQYFPGTPFFWLWYHIPGMDKMRVPAKFLSITGLSWSIVAAMGLDAVKTLFAEQEKNRQKQIFMIILGAFAVLSLVWLSLLWMTDGGDPSPMRKVLGRANRTMIDAALTGRINAVLSMASLFTGMVVLFGLIYKKPQWNKILPIVVILLTMQNLYVSNRFYIERTYVDEKSFYPKTELIDFLKKNLGLEYRASGSLYLPNVTGSPHPMGSVVEQHLYPLNNNDLTYSFPYYDINMFGRIPISRLDDAYTQFFKASFESVPAYQNYNDIWELSKRLWYIGNVRYLLVGSENEQVFTEQLARDTVFVTNVLGSYQQPVAIYELYQKLPRFALVHNVKHVYDLYLFTELKEALTNIDQFIMPIEDSGFPSGLPRTKRPIINNNNQEFLPPSPLTPERKNYNAYDFDVNITKDSIFYFGDLADEGWKAVLDGQETSIYKANGIQQYFVLPVGTQKVELFYDRPVGGLLYSRILIALAIIFALILWVFRKSQKI